MIAVTVDNQSLLGAPNGSRSSQVWFALGTPFLSVSRQMIDVARRPGRYLLGAPNMPGTGVFRLATSQQEARS